MSTFIYSTILTKNSYKKFNRLENPFYFETMLQLFKTNQPITVIFLLIYAFLLRMHNFIFPTDWQPTNANFLSDVIYGWIGTNGLFANITALLLIIIQAIIINQIVTNNKIQKANTFFSGLTYVLIASALPDFLVLHPLHFANTFFIIAIGQLFQSYRKFEAASELFNLGFFIALGSLFYFSINVILIWAILGLIVIRAFNLKELLIIFIGFFVPFFLAGTYLFWNDNLDLLQESWTTIQVLDIQIAWNTSTYFKLGLISFIILLCLVNFQSFYARTNIKVQKYITMLYWALVISALSIFYQAQIGLEHLLIFTAPLAVFLGFFLQKIKNPAIAEFFHLTLLIIVLILQYQTLIFK